MALRTLAARMRTPAAAVSVRLSPAPRVSAPAGTVRGFFSFQHNSFFTSLVRMITEGKMLKKVYQENLKLLNAFKKQERDIKNEVRTLTVASKFLKWSFRLLIPIPLTATVLKVTH